MARIFQPAPDPEACVACRHYGADPAAGWGACRKRAPILAPEGSAQLRGWPAVYDDDLCGEFERRFIPSEDQPEGADPCPPSPNSSPSSSMATP